MYTMVPNNIHFSVNAVHQPYLGQQPVSFIRLILFPSIKKSYILIHILCDICNCDSQAVDAERKPRQVEKNAPINMNFNGNKNYITK